jgi:membrane associated rhomboid family serine protease
MFALVSFGSIIERYFGAKRFFIFYFTCGIGAGLLYLLTSYWELQPKLALYGEQVLDMPVAVGASGAIYGLLMAFGLLFPNAMVGAFLIIPMRAKYAVLLFGLIELYSGINQSQSDNIAHFAHLGGMIFGFILIKIWKIPRAM